MNTKEYVYKPMEPTITHC